MLDRPQDSRSGYKKSEGEKTKNKKKSAMPTIQTVPIILQEEIKIKSDITPNTFNNDIFVPITNIWDPRNKN